MSEIEQPEVIEPIGTVTQDLTHEEYVNPLGNLTPNPIDEIGIQTEIDSPVESRPDISVNEIQQQQLPEQPDDLPNLPTPTTQRKQRRKGKKPNVQEDDSIDDEFASRLDMSCADTESPAPQIENAHVAEYIRYCIRCFIVNRISGNAIANEFWFQFFFAELRRVIIDF